MATHSTVLAWRIPRTGEPAGLPSMGVTQSQTQLKQLSSSSSSMWNRGANEAEVIQSGGEDAYGAVILTPEVFSEGK